MTGLERVLATVGGAPVDRRPFTALLSLAGARLTGCDPERHYRDPVKYAAGQDAVRDTFGPDVLFAPFSLALVGEAFGSQLRFFADQPPNLRRPALQSIDDWSRLSWPDVEVDERIAYLCEAVALLARRHGAELAICAPLPTPMDLPALVLGLDAWMEAMLFEPALAARALDQVIPFVVRLANRMLAAGATFVAFPSTLTSTVVMTRDAVASFGRETLQRALPAIRGPVVLHNGGAPVVGHLDLLAGLPNVIGQVVDPDEDRVAARAIIGPAPVLLTGPSAAWLQSRSAAEVESLCAALLRDHARDPRFVLLTTGADVTWETPHENLHALRRAVEAFGAPSP